MLHTPVGFISLLTLIAPSALHTPKSSAVLHVAVRVPNNLHDNVQYVTKAMPSSADVLP